MSFIREVYRTAEVDEHYAFSIPAIADLESLQFHQGVTFFVGENGSGKSTLLEALAMASGFPPQGGSKFLNDWNSHPEERVLANCLRLVRGHRRERDGFFLRAETFFNVATILERLEDSPFLRDQFLRRNYGGNLHDISHGESFLNLALNRFRPDSLFFFDEPEAALSPQRQLSFLLLLDELVQQRCQFVIATHSPILMAFPKSKLYFFSDDGIRETAYQETEHFRFTRDFLQNKERYLRHLTKHAKYYAR